MMDVSLMTVQLEDGNSQPRLPLCLQVACKLNTWGNTNWTLFSYLTFISYLGNNKVETLCGDQVCVYSDYFLM